MQGSGLGYEARNTNVGESKLSCARTRISVASGERPRLKHILHPSTTTTSDSRARDKVEKGTSGLFHRNLKGNQPHLNPDESGIILGGRAGPGGRMYCDVSGVSSRLGSHAHLDGGGSRVDRVDVRHVIQGACD